MGRAAPTGALLERAESMSVLDRMLADVRAESQGRLVFVGGEAGVGKTLLLRSFCDAQAKPIRILWGACEPLRTPRPLGPFVDVAESAGGELEKLVAQGSRPHEVAAMLLAELRRGPPTVLVLEDVHWADEATLDVLVLLAARIGSAPALVLASYRDDELDRAEQLRVVLGEMRQRPGRIKVKPLSATAVAELAEPHGVDAAQLYRMTAGNPFFVVEAIAAGGERIPETVRDAVLARAMRLSPPARDLLEAVAVVSGQVELWLLEQLAGELVDRIDECLASGMLLGGRAHVSFRHELARLAIEEAMSPSRRVALHRTALAALTANDPDFARRADHAEACGDTAAVLEWAPRAAERAAASGAHREAAAQYARALRFADRVSADRRAELLRRRVNECWMTDQFDAAIDAQQDALNCMRRLSDRLGEGDALRTLSRLMFFVGRVEEGEALAQQAVELLERLPAGHELAMAYANVSQRRMALQDLDAATSWGNRALDLARRLDDTEVRVYALQNIGAAELRAGLHEGPTKLDQALALALEHGLEDYAGRAFVNVVLSSVQHRDFDLAEAYLEPGLEYCRERGLDTWRLYLLACSARLELDRGRWHEAGEGAELVLRDPRSAAYPRGIALTTLGLLRARRGDPDSLAPLDEELALALQAEEVDRIGPVAAARAEARWLAGETAAVEQETDAALSLALRRQAMWIVGDLACWRWRAGVKETFAPGAAAEPSARSIAGDWSQASALWRKRGYPYEAALAQADADDESAVRRAYDQLQAMGARPAAAIVARRLRERGVRLPRGPRARTRENPAGLTARELEVLALLAEGMRNAQIAERLVVSEKTIDHHVSAVLRKLAARTRGEAVAQAAKLGLAGQDG